MTAALNTDRLGKLLALASSDNDAEALAALRKAKGMLAAAGKDFVSVAQGLGQPPAPVYQPHPSQPASASGNPFAGFDDWMEDREPGWKAKTAAERAERKRKESAERAEILARYGSEPAALARNPMEQALHDAVAQWLTGPYAPLEEFDYLRGRWHERLDGWRTCGQGNPSARVMMAITAAIPLPTTVAAAKAEYDAWEARDREISIVIDNLGDTNLDIPAYVRRDIVRNLIEKDLPAADFADLMVRIDYAAAADWKDAVCDLVVVIQADLKRLLAEGNLSNLDSITPPVPPVQSGHPTSTAARRAHVLELLSNLDTAGWSDRAIAKAAGVSPTTVGTLRRRLSTEQPKENQQ